MADSSGCTPEAIALLQSILATACKLASDCSPEQLAGDIVEATKSLLDATDVRVWLREGEGDALVLSERASLSTVRIEADTDLVQALAAGTTLAVPLDGSAGTGTVLCLPLRDHDHRLLGALELTHTRIAAFDAQATLLAEVVAAQCAAALRQAMLQVPAQHARQLHAEVEVARNLQQSTLPTRMPDLPGYELHGHFQPTTYAGGDLFDIVSLQHGLFLLLGDATGHGFGPALSATQMQGMLRVAFRLGADLDQAFLHVNNQLAEDLPDDRFVTAFMGFLDPDSHIVRFHSAGQPALHYQAAEASSEWLAPATFPVGSLHQDQVADASHLKLAPGDVLALISDGVYEQPGPHEQEFGFERVSAVLCDGHALPMPELCDRLLREVEHFAAGIPQADDITILLVRRMP